MSKEPPRQSTDKATLSKDLSEFLIEFAIALNKHSIYPEGHPSLPPACEGVVRKLSDLLVEKSTLSLGVAQDQLVIEGVATDPKNPVLADLAGRLHRHHLGAIMFSQGLHPDELHDVLAMVAEEADHSEPLGLGPSATLSQWAHVRLYSMTFDQLELAQDGVKKDTEDGAEAEHTGLSAQLWLGLARASLGTQGNEGDGSDEPLDEEKTDPTFVAAQIDQRKTSGEAYDQVIVGYMMKIAEELKSSRGTEAVALKKRMAKLVSALSEGTLDRLLEMGGNRDQRKEFLLNAAEGMTADAVLELVNTAGKKDQQTISNSMLRLLQKMAHHAENDRGKRRDQADRSLREQVSELIKGWSLIDPNPDGYTMVLEKMSQTAPTFSVAPDVVFEPEPNRIFQMALEVDVTGVPVTKALDDLIDDGQLGWVLDTMEQAGDSAVMDAAWAQLSSNDTLLRILEQEPLDIRALDQLLDHLGVLAAESMLDALAEAESTTTRRVLLDRLAKMGSEIGPQVAARLRDNRWYVQRNMLNLLGSMETLPEEFVGADFMQHADPRVRREALNILVKNPAHRDRAICLALADSDIRSVQLGLVAAQTDCPSAAVSMAVSRATDSSNPDLQVAAIRVLASVQGRAALDALLQVAAPTKSLFGTKLPPKTSGYLAALRALHVFEDDVKARRSLAAAARSKDPEIVKAAMSRITGVHGATS